MKVHPATIRQMTILGCLATAPEDRLTSAQKHVTVFSVMTYHRDQTGDIHTDYTRCVAFERVAEQALKAGEGDYIFATGDFRDRRWRDQAGGLKTTQELTVTSFRILTAAQAAEMHLLSTTPADSNSSGIPSAGKTTESSLS